MNSFSGVRRALEYEIPRQIREVTAGRSLVQETRRWDDLGGVTESMRSKEHAHDYRYFPEPDLMPFLPTGDWLREVSSRVVELPLARKQRFQSAYQIPAGDAQSFVDDPRLGAYFERIAVKARNPKAVANWVINNLRARMTDAGVGLEEVKIAPDHLLELIALVDQGQISSRIAQDVFAEMFATGDPPGAIVERHGLVQLSDAGELEALCNQVIAANPKSADDFRAGKTAALNFLKGQVMKLSKGKANPGVVGEILQKKLVASSDSIPGS